MSKSSSKKSVRKSSPKTNGQKNGQKKVAAKKAQAARELNPLHVKLLKLLSRASGATQAELVAAGSNRPAKMSVAIFAKRGFKTTQKKADGEPTNYYVRK